MIFCDFGWLLDRFGRLWIPIWSPFGLLWPSFFDVFFRSDFLSHFFHCAAATAVPARTPESLWQGLTLESWAVGLKRLASWNDAEDIEQASLRYRRVIILALWSSILALGPLT